MINQNIKRWIYLVTIYISILAISFILYRLYLFIFPNDLGQLKTDFLPFYSAGLMLLEGNINLIYDSTAQATYYKDAIGQAMNVKFMYLNPPFTSFLYAPFALFGYKAGFVLWNSTSIFLFYLGGILLTKSCHSKNMARPIELSSYALAFFPTVIWIVYGQATGIIFFLLCSTIYFLMNKKEFTAGFLLGLLIFKPHMALPLALPILIKLRYRAIAGGITSAATIILLSIYFIPDLMYQYIALQKTFIHDLAASSSFRDQGSINDFFALFFGKENIQFNALATILTSLILLAYIVRRWIQIEWNTKSDEWLLLIASTFIIGMLLSMRLMWYDVTLILIPIFLASSVLIKHQSVLNDNSMFAWIMATYMACNFSPWFVDLQTDLLGNEAYVIQPITIIILGLSISIIRFSDKISRNTTLI